MNNLFIIIFSFICIVSYSQKNETIDSFDLTIDEVYGCYSHEPYYINYNFNGNDFCITYSGPDKPLKKQCLNKIDFQVFYDSLQSFDLSSMKTKYNQHNSGSASHFGKLTIIINHKTDKEIDYRTRPADSTNFMGMYNWLFDKAINISDFMDIELLISTNFYNTKNPIRNVYPSVELNSKNFNSNEIIRIIDTTKNEILKNTLISSLGVFKNEAVLNKLGGLILSNMNKEDIYEYGHVCYSCSTIVLTPFLKQDSSEQKINYLKEFLNSKSNIIKTESSIALASYGLNGGKNILLDNFNKINSNKSYIHKRKLFYSLYLIADQEIEQKLHYRKEKLKKTNFRKTSEKKWEMKYLTLTLDLISKKKKLIKFEEFDNLLNELKI